MDGYLCLCASFDLWALSLEERRRVGAASSGVVVIVLDCRVFLWVAGGLAWADEIVGEVTARIRGRTDKYADTWQEF